MPFGMYAYGFGMGTFKYLFAQWIMVVSYRGIGRYDYDFLDIFLPTYLGAIFTMTIFYWGSEYFMNRASNKRAAAALLAKSKGEIYLPKKKFTRINKTLVKIRRSLGIYPFTFLAPLFLSIPLGSIICAKFFGHHKKTFPLMLLFTALYGVSMTILMLYIYD
ncbi:MAG: hypothetical protein AB8B74_10125 [Crocinitomicaceae bacterium]